MSGSIKLAYADELRPGECKVVSIASKQLALYNVAGIYYATSNRCSHKGGPLGDGELKDCIVKCPWHEWYFDVTTGRNMRDASITIETYPLKIEDTIVCLQT